MNLSFIEKKSTDTDYKIYITKMLKHIKINYLEKTARF